MFLTAEGSTACILSSSRLSRTSPTLKLIQGWKGWVFFPPEIKLWGGDVTASWLWCKWKEKGDTKSFIKEKMEETRAESEVSSSINQIFHLWTRSKEPVWIYVPRTEVVDYPEVLWVIQYSWSYRAGSVTVAPCVCVGVSAELSQHTCNLLELSLKEKVRALNSFTQSCIH